MPRWSEEKIIYITAEEILERRKKLGLTQKAFAEIIGTYQPIIARWESGKTVPTKIMAGFIRSAFEALEAG
jgi:predicted transcriptional regulator